MKTGAIVTASLCLGCAVNLIIASNIYSHWIDLGFKRLVSLWLARNGLDDLVGVWGMVWLQLPEWILAFAVGLLYQFIFRERFVLPAVAFCCGMIGTEIAVSIYFEIWSAFGFGIAFASVLWSLIIVPIHFLGASTNWRNLGSKPRWRFNISHVLLATCGCALTIVTIKYGRSIGTPLLILGVLSLVVHGRMKERAHAP